jgi:hypothetical protein
VQDPRHPRQILDLAERSPRLEPEDASLAVRLTTTKPPRAGRAPQSRAFARPVMPRPCGEMTSGRRGCFFDPYHAGTTT